MLATLSPGIVEGPEWVFEEKYDGIRAVAGRERGQVKIWSRTFQDLTLGFPRIVEAVNALGDGDLMVDGESVTVEGSGNGLNLDARHVAEFYGRQCEFNAVAMNLLEAWRAHSTPPSVS